MALFLVSLTAVFAANTITLNFYDEDGNPVDNVEVSVFECTDKTCSDIITETSSMPSTKSERHSRVAYDDTESSNTAELSIPETETSTFETVARTWYIAWAFAGETDAYLPTYQTFYLRGDGNELETDLTLQKKDLCLSTIQSFSVTNTGAAYEPITVSVEAGLEADTYSAFELSDDSVYLYGTTGQYKDWYSAETEVTLTITKIATFGSGLFATPQRVTVYSDSEIVEIFAGESENIAFSWTPTREGIYTATVTASVSDSQCESTEEQSSAERFTVVEAGATEYCYTLIDNLAVQEIEESAISTLQVGETYTVTFDKISNSVDSAGNLAAQETELDISVKNEEGNLDYSLADTAAANADTETYETYSFSWAPVSEGDNTIIVSGSAVDCAYSTNNEETASLTINVEGTSSTSQAPVAEITVSDATYFFPFGYISLDADVGFDATGSYDPDGSLVSYAWDFGDGTTSTDVSSLHTYDAAGTYTVTLTVTDDDGLTDTEEVSVTMSFWGTGTEETDPTAECSGPYDENDNIVSEATIGQELFFEGDGSDADGGDVTFSWDFDGDGTEDSAADEDFFSYNAEGSYTATLTVTDDEGATAQCSVPLSVQEEAGGQGTDDLPAVAIASATPLSGDPTLWVQFSSEGSSGDEPLSYYWNFGSGEGSSSRANPGHYYDKEGTYTVTLIVTDADGDQDTATLTIIVGEDDAEQKTENLADAQYFVEGIALTNDGFVKAGDALELWVSAENSANFDKEDVSVNAIIQELGIYETSGEFNLDAGDSAAKVLTLSLPEGTEPGTYDVRITISDDHVKRVIYRDIIVTA